MKKILSLSLATLFVAVSFVSCSTPVEEGISTVPQYSDGNIYSDNALDNDPMQNGDASQNDNSQNDNSQSGDSQTGDAGTSKPAGAVKDSTAGLQFTLNADGASYTLTGIGSCTSTSIVIDGYKGLPVTKIGYGAFENNKNLTSVKIGDYVEIVDDYAFSMCSKITSVTFGSGIKEIGLYSFRYCDGLTSISLGKNVKTIEYGAFYKAKNLASITIPDSVRIIGEYAFTKTKYYDDSSKWSSNVLYIGKHLIEAKNSVSGKYTVKDGTLTIAEFAFGEPVVNNANTSITGIVVPNSVKAIGNRAFQKCKNLSSVTFGTGIEYVGEHAFKDTKFYNTSSNWKNNVLYAGKCAVAAKTTISGAISITDGTKVIADMAFASCANATGVVIPESVVYVGQYAFLDCAKLAEVTIGSGVKEIGTYAFKGCSMLGSIVVKKTSGWTADGVSVDANALSDKSNAAAQLCLVSAGKTWKHA